MGSGNGVNSKNGKRARARDDDRPAIWVGYGKLLKLFREQAGLTQEKLAELIGYSPEQAASVEQGRRPAKAPFTAAAERVLKAGGALDVLQEEVDFAKLPAFFRDFAVLELEAVSHFSYEPLLVPGLLQTEEYARALFEHHCPSMNAEAVEQNVEARLNRQKLLTKSPRVELSFVIGETTLCNPVGGRHVMGKQLRHLLSCGETHNLELQVMRSATGYHPGLGGPFVLLETGEYRQYGYVESQEVGSVVSDPGQVSTFRLRCGKLRSQALNVEESVAFIEQLAEDT